MANPPEWTVLEKLLLAQAVYKFGEDSWVDVARNLRQHNMLNRQPEFFNQKNCSLQYYLMIEQLESETRRQTKSAVGAQDMPPVVKLARQLYMQRIDELKLEIKKDSDRFLTLISDIDAIRSGRQDALLAGELEKQNNAHKPPPSPEQQQHIETADAFEDDDGTAAPAAALSQENEAPTPKDDKVHNVLQETEKDLPADDDDEEEEQKPLFQRDDASALEDEERMADNVPSTEKVSSNPPPPPPLLSQTPSTESTQDFAIHEGDQKWRSDSAEDGSVKRRRIEEAGTVDETGNSFSSRKLTDLG